MANEGSVFQEIVRKIVVAAQSQENVCIIGEVGTGKRQAAVAIHNARAGSEARFTMVNCMGLTHDEFAADMFGKVSADGDLVRKGAVSFAEGGTLYMHEVHELTKQSQALLVRFIETQSYHPVGSGASISSNLRLVVSSSATLETLSEAGLFRQDLQHLLTPIVIHMPRLNDRIGDIPALFSSLLQEFAGQYDRQISPDAMDRLRQHSYNGNLMELRNIAMRVSVQKPEGEITRSDIDQAIKGTAYFDLASHDTQEGPVDYITRIDSALLIAQQEPENINQLSGQNKKESVIETSEKIEVTEFDDLNKPSRLSEMKGLSSPKGSMEIQPEDGSAVSNQMDEQANLDSIYSFKDHEIKYFKELLTHFNGDKQLVADTAGLTLRTLYRRLKSLGID